MYIGRQPLINRVASRIIARRAVRPFLSILPPIPHFWGYFFELLILHRPYIIRFILAFVKSEKCWIFGSNSNRNVKTGKAVGCFPGWVLYLAL
jgi:hypothetical protein